MNYRKSLITIILVVTTLVLSGCGSSNSSNTSSEESEAATLPEYVQAWQDACTKDSLSDECTKYVRDMRVSDYLFGTNSDDQDLLVADFDGASFTDNLGRIYCIDGECVADLILSNYGNSAWDDALQVQLLGKESTFDATSNIYFNAPLNPGLDRYERVYFTVGRNMDGMEQLWIKSYITEGLEATIELCKIEEESEVKDFPGIVYENCLRLKHVAFSPTGFVPKSK